MSNYIIILFISNNINLHVVKYNEIMPAIASFIKHLWAKIQEFFVKGNVIFIGTL